MKYLMKKKVRVYIFLILALLAIAEVLLRYVFGLCDVVLYEESSKYEYIAQPNQDRFVLFSHVRFNSFSQRSEEPDSTKTIVLGLGDSVLFGGQQVDQDSLATTLFTKETGMQMLNISAGSWGPDNCVEYIREHGTFNARAIVLVCSSHDAYDRMTFMPVVGVWDNYPKEQKYFALQVAWNRYVYPRIRQLIGVKEYLDPDAQIVKRSENRQVVQKSDTFVQGFDHLKEIADSANIPLYIYLHAELGELQDGAYNNMGQEIIQWCHQNDVSLIQDLREGIQPDMYRDILHLNEKGQRHLANVMKTKIRF